MIKLMPNIEPTWKARSYDNVATVIHVNRTRINLIANSFFDSTSEESDFELNVEKKDFVNNSNPSNVKKGLMYLGYVCFRIHFNNMTSVLRSGQKKIVS